MLDLIPTDQNIFGLQDVTAEEEAASLPVEGEEMSPEDLEAAIEAELGGRAAAVAAHDGGGRTAALARGRPLAPVFAPDGAPADGGVRRTAPLPPMPVALTEKLRAYDPKADTGLIDAAYTLAAAGARHAAPRQRRSLHHAPARGGRHPGRLPARHRLDRHRRCCTT